MSRFRSPRVFTILIVLLIVSAFSATAQEAPRSGDDEDGLPPGVVHVDQETAFAHDAALMAEQTGLPVEEVERALVFQDAFTIYGMEILLPRYEDQISAIWVDPIPATRGYVQFVAEIPQQAIADATQRGLDIDFAGGGEISMAEHTLRSELAAEALIAAGYRDFIAYSDRQNKVIKIELQLPEESPQPDPAEFVDLVRDHVSADRSHSLVGRAAEIQPSDLELIVIRGTGPIIELQHSRGGNRVRDSNDGSVCTSGWSVSGNNGGGIITAGHCDGLDTFVEANGNTYGMNMQVQALNSAGDVEYHTTPTHIVPPEFYATATEIRDVTLVRPTNMMVGHGVCVYGRSSNVRSCAHTVEAVDITVSGYGRMARASGISTVGGDSGGGWSTNTWAWGVHSGTNSSTNKSYFTPAEQAEAGLSNRNVQIKTK